MGKHEAIIDLHREGKSCGEIAKALKALKVTKSTVWYTINRYEETKSVKNRPKSGRPRSVRTKKHEPSFSKATSLHDATGLRGQGLHPRKTV